MKRTMGNAGLAAVISFGLFAAFPLTAWAEPVFPQGVGIGSESLAGMTREQAGEKASRYVDGLAGQKVTLVVDGQNIETTAGELGFHWSNTGVVAQAADLYAGGSLIRQYMNRKDLAAAPVELELDTEVDSGKLKEFVDAQCQTAAAQPRNASITRENGQFVITDSVPGKVVDTEATEQALNEALEGGLEEPVTVTAPVTEQQPSITAGDLSTIHDVLGTYTTDFSSSGTARSTNLAVGASKINGHLLMPGEELSGYECLQPFTTDNGYKTASAYENGQVVDSIGGGVCQLATTLYNSSLEAELDVVQRQNHSMIVTYVKPSRDAAIAGTFKDIKIRNNYSTPIYVEGYTDGRKLTFTIYGQETRPPGRKVEYISETLGSTSPGEPQLIVDNSLPPGAKVKVQSSHTGLRSRLWKVVTVDGVEQERTLVSKDSYNPSKAIYRVGPALPAVVPPEPSVPAPVETVPLPQETEPSSVTGVDGGPGMTRQAPKEAAVPQVPTLQAPPSAVQIPDPADPAPSAPASIPEGTLQ